jgi:protein-tyrosine phosphatase
MINSILFVCIGNICRSPMAEGLFKAQLNKINSIKFFVVGSAGLHALVGRPAAEESQEIMCNIGIDITQHRAKQLSPEMVTSSDLILVMEKLQKREIELLFPHARGKVHLLGKWSNFEVPDPYNKPLQAFSNCLELFEQGWQDWQDRLL